MESNPEAASRASLGRVNAARRVIVSLEFLPANTSVRTPITNEFSSHLPLTDLQWKSSSRSTTRTIESLNLEFRSFQESTKDAAPHQIPINLLERPYLHLMFVASDDNEAYRVTLRPQIREWLNTVQKKKLQEWLIIHVTSQKTGPAKFYIRKGSVFDKIRADFNIGKRDRVLQLPVPGSLADDNNKEYSSIWRDFLLKVKESIIFSFDANFTSYEEDVRKIDSQRQLPGWNFCTFFIQKEGLAHSFEAMNLLEDALLQYDELEASYYLGAKDQTFPWFSRIGGNLDGDDSLSILSGHDKPYRGLIMQNDISVFDFRIYLFSRQASLVSGLGRVVDLAKRAKSFIYSMAKMLRSHHGLLKKYFMESWTFTASLVAVDECHRLLNARKMNAAAIPDLLPILAELLELATRQVEKLGMTCGYLPRAHPFLMSAQSLPLEELEDQEGDADMVLESPVHLESSNTDLQDSFGNEAAFDRMYRSMLDRVHEAWSGSLRMRNANKVKGTLAALEQARNNHNRALDIYSTLVNDFDRTRWVAVEAQLLRQTVALSEDLDDADGQTRRLLSVLALIRNGLSTGSLSWTLATRRMDGPEAASSLLAEARQLSGKLNKDFAIIDVPAFTVSLASAVGHFLEGEDGVNVEVTIASHLPCTIDVEDIRLKFTSTHEEPIWLASGSVQLKPGNNNSVTVSALVSLVGIYALDTSQIRTSHIVFQHTHRDDALSASSVLKPYSLTHHKQPVVNFAQDPLALDITAEEVTETCLDKPRQMVLTVHAGRQTPSKATIYFEDTTNKLQIIYETATLVNGSCLLQVNSDSRSLTLSSISETDTLQISLAYHSLARSQHIYLPLTVHYHTTDRPEKRRLLRTCIRLRTALPLDVTVHDYRRGTFLLSKFTVSTPERLPLRVKQALLEDTPSFRVVPGCRERNKPVNIKREQPGVFPFRLERQTGSANSPDGSNNDDMRLKITFVYRTTEADLLAILKPHLAIILRKHRITLSRRLIEAIAFLFLADTHVIKHFNSLLVLERVGKEDVRLSRYQEPARFSKYRDSLRSYWTTEDEWDRIQLAILEAYQTPASTGLLVNEPWHSISIPFEVPTVAIFNSVSLGLPPLVNDSIPVGERFPCVLRINSTLDWGNSEERRYFRNMFNTSQEQTSSDKGVGRGQDMLYEISFDQHDWAVVGKARSTYTISAMEGYNLECPLDLIPLHQGNLLVPSVVVLPLPAVQGEREIPTYQAELPSSETYQDDVATCVEVVQASSGAPDVAYDHVTERPGNIPVDTQ